jgi:hypothetical protein
MKPEVISAAAALVSAISALITTYLYRKQGKGFIWTKDPKPLLSLLPNGDIHLTVEIPLYNLGLGNIQFYNLKTKKVYLKNNSIENFDCDMDEAYFPPGVLVLNFRTPIYTDDKSTKNLGISTQLRINRNNTNPEDIDETKLQEDTNKKLSEIGEVIFILKCCYKDGSWFGLKKRTTTIGMVLSGVDLSFLSTARRKELKKLFD